jgi:hypothetical protein
MNVFKCYTFSGFLKLPSKCWFILNPILPSCNQQCKQEQTIAFAARQQYRIEYRPALIKCPRTSRKRNITDNTSPEYLGHTKLLSPTCRISWLATLFQMDRLLGTKVFNPLSQDIFQNNYLNL